MDEVLWTSEDETGYWEWPSPSPLVRSCWRVVADVDGSWTTGGAEYWALAFTELPDGGLQAQVSGPTTRPRTLQVRAGERSWGVDLEAHVFWRGSAKTEVVDDLWTLPTERVAETWWFVLGGVRVAVPAVHELTAAIDQLAAVGLLQAEVSVARVLEGGGVEVPDRTMRRRFQTATGMRRGQVAQVRRARLAYQLMQRGMTLAEAASQAGFADQAHMTRHLRALAGCTPAQILDREHFSM